MNGLSRWWNSKSTGFKLFVGAFAVTAGILALGAFGITGASGFLNGAGEFLVNSFNGLINFSNNIGSGINGLFGNPLNGNGAKFVGAMATTGASLLVVDGVRRGASGFAGRRGYGGRNKEQSQEVERAKTLSTGVDILNKNRPQEKATEQVAAQKMEHVQNVQAAAPAKNFALKQRSNNALKQRNDNATSAATSMAR